MKVRELIEKLSQADPEANVLMHCYEEAGRVESVVRNGDTLYYRGDPAHEPGEGHIYLTDQYDRWLSDKADII